MGIKQTSKPVLTISLLVSNRPETIPRCLDSVRALMKEIPSELILVDTSGSVEIHRLLLTYTDQVIPFTWCDDFAKARNEGLKRAHGEWFLFLDDDEWFVETKPLVDFFRSGTYRNYACANYIVRSFYDADYTCYNDSWVSRMVKVTPDVTFQGKIHEYIYGAQGRATTLQAVVYHSGYVYATEEDRRRHFERNSHLLKEMIREEPDVMRWKVQLAQEYRSVRDWKELAAFCGQCLLDCAQVNNRYGNYDIGTFYAGELLGCLYSNQLDRGIEAGEAELRDPRSSELSHAHTYHYLGLIALYQKQWKKAEDYMHKFLGLERELKKTPEKLEAQKWALMVCEAFDVVPMKRAYSVLIVCGWKQKRLDALHKYFKKLEWDQKNPYELDKMPDYLIEAVATLHRDTVLDEMLALGWRDESMKLKLFACAEGWKERDTEAYYRILHSVSRIEDTHWYPSYAAVMYAAHAGKVHLLPEAFRKFAEHLDNIFLFPTELLVIARQNHVSLEPVYLAVPYRKWCRNLNEYIQTVEKDDLAITCRELKAMQKTVDMRYDYAYVHLTEQLVPESLERRKYADKHPYFRAFADSAIHYCARLYQPCVTEDYPELLPGNLAAGIWIGRALELEETNLSQAIHLYHQAAQAYPPMQEALRSYMVSLQKHADIMEWRHELEFRKLLEETKQQVREFLAQGNVEAAREILGQLKQLAPGDLDVAELMLRTRLAENPVQTAYSTGYLAEAVGQ